MSSTSATTARRSAHHPISTIKSVDWTSLLHSSLLLRACTRRHTICSADYKDLFRVPKLCGLAKDELTPSLVSSFLGTKPHQRPQVAKGGKEFSRRHPHQAMEVILALTLRKVERDDLCRQLTTGATGGRNPV